MEGLPRDIVIEADEVSDKDELIELDSDAVTSLLNEPVLVGVGGGVMVGVKLAENVVDREAVCSSLSEKLSDRDHVVEREEVSSQVSE